MLAAVISDARGQNGIQNFYGEWLPIRNIPQLDNKNTPAYATFAAGENVNVTGHNHRADMIQEILDMTAYYTFTTSGRYEDLLTSPYSFAKTTDLAHLYGVSTLWSPNTSPTVSFPVNQPRSGLLTRAAFLAGGTEYTSPIIKGRNMRINLLCDQLPAPPPGAAATPMVQDAITTTRVVVERAQYLSREEVVHLVGKSGFEVLGQDFSPVPYFQNPASAHWRIEHILSFLGRKVTDCPVPESTVSSDLPDWIEDTAKPIQLSLALPELQKSFEFSLDLLKKLSIYKSVQELATALSGEYGMNQEEAEYLVSSTLAQWQDMSRYNPMKSS